ncbi:MAG: hypothetical protein QG577_117 [Thermodesulfobacteriota bacterium]|nr:hypothetical protein [Thermodesulfobacteriota bacterium]
MVILALCLYSYFNGAQKVRTFERMIGNPQAYAGTIFPFSYARVIEVQENGLFVYYSRQQVKAFPTPQGTEVSCKISFLGELQSDGTFRIAEYHIHRDHTLKIFVSLIALIFVFTLFLRRFKFDPHRFLFQERPRGHA